MKLTLDQLTNRIDRVLDWRDDLEARQDAIWIDYANSAAGLNAMNRWRRWQAEAEQLNRRMAGLAAHIPGCLGNRMVVAPTASLISGRK